MTETGSNRVARQTLSAADSQAASRRWWDKDADDYQAEHGDFLGDISFVWGPEGISESDLRVLGDLTGCRVVELGCGAAQCSRWLRAQGIAAAGIDLSAGQLSWSQTLDARHGVTTPVVQADAARLSLADDSVDAVFSAYGAVQFVADLPALLVEVARVLRPGGRFAASVTHPIRWSFPDDPGPGGLVARTSYWDRRAYVEYDDAGSPAYVEHHRTIGDYVRAVHAAGLTLVDLVEPEWPTTTARTWGGWSPARGAVIPGTAIIVADKPPASHGRGDL